MSYSKYNHFPGYEFKKLDDNKYHNMYRGVDLGKGGYVFSNPGIYSDVALIDVQSMHPTSAVNLRYFGDYTQKFKDLMDARIAIKHKDFDKVKHMFDGKLAKYLDDPTLAKQLATALKLAINSVYGLTSASFDNPFRDSRNVNNIIALRGALFMKTLQDEVTSMGYTVVAIRTDSIKVANATNDIIRFCMEFASEYGYSFQHEASYERMCQIDKANYVASYMEPEICESKYGYVPDDNGEYRSKSGHSWTATGDTFQRPFVFKTMFTGEELNFDDKCITSSVKDAAIYLDMNEQLEQNPDAVKELLRREHNEQNPDSPMKLNKDFAGVSTDQLMDIVAAMHDYQFVGRVGRFCPIRPGAGGGELLVYRRNKYDAVSGSKGHRWLEAEVVKALGKEKDIDQSYFDEQIDEAIKAIEKFGSYEAFVDISKPYDWKSPVKDLDGKPPFDLVPCGDGKYNTCLDCPNCVNDICKRGYSLNSYVEAGGDA